MVPSITLTLAEGVTPAVTEAVVTYTDATVIASPAALALAEPVEACAVDAVCAGAGALADLAKEEVGEGAVAVLACVRRVARTTAVHADAAEVRTLRVLRALLVSRLEGCTRATTKNL